MTEKLTYDDLKGRVQDLENGISTQNRFQNISHTLFKISSAINTTSNLDELYKSIHGELSSVIDTTNFFIAIYDKIQDNLTFPYCVDSVDGCYPPIIEISKAESLTAKVIRTGLPLLITKDEMLSQRQKSQKIIPACTLSKLWLGVPLKIEAAIIGVMAVQSYDDANCYDKTDLEVLVSVADQVAIAIDRKSSENTLRESESYMRSIFRAAPTGIGVVHDRIFRQVNDKFCEMVGYSRNDLIGTQASLIYPSVEEFEKVGREKYEQIKTKGTGTVETVMQRKNGELINVLMSSAPIEVNNLSAGVTFTALDITDRKLAEKALHDSHERFLTVLDSIDAAIHVADIKTHEILFMNQYMIDSFGQDMTGKICWKAFRGESTPCAICTNNRLVDKNNVPTGVVVWKDKNPVTGKRYINHDRAIEWTGGRLVRLQIATDITDLLSMEAQLRQAQKMESIGLMAGGVAHDLNNILSGIVSYPELILHNLPQQSKIRKPLEAIHESGQRAAAVVSDLLTVARNAVSTRELYSLNVLVQEYLTSPEGVSLKSLYPGIELHYTPEAAHPNILCSPVHVKKCLMNLVLNGMEAIESMGTLSISTYNKHITEDVRGDHSIQQGSYVVLSIQDTGGGISDKDLEHIFEPFYTKKTMGRSGTGLGLAVVWNTLEDHEGKIFVQSSEQGTCFQLYFPERKEDAVLVNENEGINVGQGGGEYILVVDDEPQLRDIASQMLQNQGYIVESVSSGELAVELVKEKPFDLILLDMLMEPGMNGRQTYEEILNIYPEQKAVIVSGFSESEDVKAAIRLGVGGFVKKPYLMDQLKRAVKNALNG